VPGLVCRIEDESAASHGAPEIVHTVIAEALYGFQPGQAQGQPLVPPER
jgi:hypothetical protein